ncbi:MAG TPA: OmpA family protein [Stellaceae bacterium]
MAAVVIAAFSAVIADLGPASAEPADGPYLRLEAGASLPGDMAATGPTGLSFTLSPDMGPLAGAALGMRLAPFRLELDVDWMHSSVKSNSPALSGSVQNIPVMLNGYVDWVNKTPFTPYIGFGMGFTAMTLTANGPAGKFIDSSERVFAFQPIVGVDYAVTDQIALGLQYRYFRSVDPGLATTSGARFSIGNASHNVLATLTYHFFAPMPPPAAAAEPAAVAPAAAPAPAPPVAAPAPRMFFVFFEFNSARLNAAGKRSADEAIASYREDPSSAIVVRGFTDLVGSDAYNLELSKRRAITVYNYFTTNGVKPADLGIDWQGKANPRVDTPKPEPQNRRVEIQM